MTSSLSLFQNKTALILGGGNGIGRAIAEEFARRGAALAVADIDEAGAATTAAHIEANGGKSCSFQCDVTCNDSLHRTFSRAEQTLGEIDIVVNNVGVIISGNPEDIPLSEWQRVVNLNLMPVVRSNEIILPKMIARGGGYIVNTASFSGLYPYASNRIPYAASKAGVVALTESLALYLLPKGIQISCFCPGPVMTGVMQGMKSWSDNAIMSGPGAQFELISAEQAGTILADGMEEKRIFIPTHASVLEEMQRHAADPDAYIRQKIEAIASGNLGLPAKPSL
ncbi:SDR family oxidoreductase [Aestuariicella hydrocarbonica]|uniref:SDR family oxidoreductase n=1 Tax=Pseudomaricurvus hydrocarbonicus TaxID=1470433 RepID=A0A9E5JRZ6_9GAMM|nr:SDR family oxidoreductase [Aestuariicella hydrocarbonica]NHO65658.1 SDR family oxidoreductase [Aestuariicella hydrocarbonica]